MFQDLHSLIYADDSRIVTRNPRATMSLAVNCNEAPVREEGNVWMDGWVVRGRERKKERGCMERVVSNL